MDEDLADFCRREHARLVRALDLLTGSLPVAEDLAQETLARVCQRWDRIRDLEAPGAYAHRIAVNLATSLFRRHAVQRRVHGDLTRGPAPTAWHDPDAASAVAVRSALMTLRIEQRRVLVLRFFLDYSVAETATLLSMPEGSVKTHTQRGLSLLRQQLGEPVSSPEEALPHA